MTVTVIAGAGCAAYVPAPPVARVQRTPRSAAAVPRTIDGRVSPAQARPTAPIANGDGDFRSRVLEQYLPLAQRLARRFAGSGEPLEDLNQVAVIGLLMAADRFDADRGAPFVSYATPTILGELKRHFRDTTWPIRVPRAMQELTLQLSPASEQLTRTLQRAPTTAELAEQLGVTSDDVHAARQCGAAYRPRSLDEPLPNTTDSCLGGLLGAPDRGYATVEARETVRGLVARLPEQDRRLLALRYGEGWSQTMIAAEIGTSQMQVSRSLARILTRLRATISFGDNSAAA